MVIWGGFILGDSWKITLCGKKHELTEEEDQVCSPIDSKEYSLRPSTPLKRLPRKEPSRQDYSRVNFE